MSGNDIFLTPGNRWSLGKWSYVFHNITPNPVQIDNVRLGRLYLGAGVCIQIPPEPTDDTINSVDGINCIPTGTVVYPQPESSPNAWKYSPITPDLKEAINADETLYLYNAWLNAMMRVKGVTQIQGIPEHQSYLFRQNENTNPYGTLIDAWVQSPQHAITWYGIFSPTSSFNTRDIRYDAQPTVATGSRLPYMSNTVPDSDWYERATLTTVNSEEFGSRDFYIMSTADGTFHCWPRWSPIDWTLTEQSPYKDQAIKTNILSVYDRPTVPAYPSWVYRNTKQKRVSYAERNNRESFEPRYTWMFNSTGKKAIAIMVHREALSKDWSAVNNYDTPPTEYFTTTNVKTFIESVYFNDPTIPSYPVQIDTVGLIELEFSINITGPDINDFDFSISVIRNEPPNNNVPMRIGIAYASNINWSKYSGVIGQINVDDIIELRITAYIKKDSLKLISALDGMYGTEEPHLTTCSIFNATKNTEIFKFVSKNMLDWGIGNLDSIQFSPIYFSNLRSLDLSTLSFVHTGHYRELIVNDTINETKTIGGLSASAKIKYAKTAVYCTAFAFGQSVYTERIGDPGVPVEYHVNNFPEINYDELEIASPDFICTWRGYANETETAYWNLDSFKAEFALRYQDMYETPESIEGTPLNLINDDNFDSEFMDRVYNRSISGILTSTRVAAKNSRFSYSWWIGDIRWLAWKIFEKAKSAALSLVQGLNDQKLWTIWQYASHAILPQSLLNYELMDRGSYSEDQYDLFIRDFPMGKIWYQRAFVDCLYQASYVDKVMVHPDGHYAVKINGPISFIGEYPVNREWYFDNCNLYATWDTFCGTQGKTAASMMTAKGDKISFWNGKYITSHVEAFNKAYQLKTTHAQYEYPMFVAINNYSEPMIATGENMIFFSDLNTRFAPAQKGYLGVNADGYTHDWCQAPLFIRC